MAQALTIRSDFMGEHSLVLALSALAHLGLFALLILNLSLIPRPPPQPMRLAIEATVVDARTLQRPAAEEERRREAEERRQQDELQQRQVEERRIEEQQRQQEQVKLAEVKRQEQAELKRRDEDRRRLEAEKIRQAKVEQDRQDTERQKREAAEAKRKAESERRQAQTKADLARQMAEEEEQVAAEDSGLGAQYKAIIEQKIRRNWTQPASARPGDSCVVNVQQIPGGEVISVKVENCTGDTAFARSVEVAVLRSSPLPLPPDPRLFDRNLQLTFKPQE